MRRVVPVFVLLDWWLASRAPDAPREALRWLAIPIVHLAYTLIRGPFADDWYRSGKGLSQSSRPASRRAWAWSVYVCQ